MSEPIDRWIDPLAWRRRDSDALYCHWRALGLRLALDVAGIDSQWAIFVHRYGRRAYHHLGHVRYLLTLVAGLDSDNALIELAIWFHDLFLPTDPDPGDERRSAESAKELLLAAHCFEQAESVAELIRGTVHDGSILPTAGSAALLHDADMSVLAWPEADYQCYADAVAREYASIMSPEAFCAGRCAFIQCLLAKPKLFSRPDFQKLETTARANLTRELAERSRSS